MTLEELNIKFTAQTSGLTSQLNGVKNQLSGLEGTATKTGISFGKMMAVGAAAGAVAAGMFAKVGKEALLMANDAVESEQLFEVSMDKMEGKARSWSEALSKSLGLNGVEVRKNVGTMNVMLLSMGMTENAAYDMSTGLTELANDMASFYNIDTQDAMGKLQSGITGMGMPLKQLGILVDDEIIKDYAMRKGISKTGKEMSQQQKVLARYGAIMEQTTKAQGDLARTMESPTNQIRQLNAQLDAAKIALGTALQPALIAILPSLTKLAVGAGNVLNAMNAAGKQTRSAFGDVGLSVQEASDAIKGAIMGKTESLVAEILAAKDAVNDAIDGYGEAATETKKVLLLMELEPKTTGYFRINEKLKSIRESLDNSLKDGIVSDLTAYLDMMYAEGKINEEQLTERKAQMNAKVQKLLDDATEFELKIKGMVDLALADGVVTPKEAADINAEIEKGAGVLKSNAIKWQVEVAAQVELDLRNDNITQEQAEQILKSVSESTKSSIGVVEGIVVDLKLEVGEKDWAKPTFSLAEKQKLAKLIETEINAGMAIVVNANSILKPTWLGTGAIGDAIIAMYDAGVERAQGSSDELQAAVNKWLETGATADFDLVQKLREKLAADIAYIQGGANIKGRVESALFAAGKDMSPENVKAVTTAYAQGLEELRAAEAKLSEERKAQVFGFVDTPDFDKILEYYGVDGLDAAIAAIEKLESDSLAMASNNTLESLGKIAGAMGSLLKTSDEGESIEYLIEIDEMLKSVDFSTLSEKAKESLKEIADAFMQSPYFSWMSGKDTFNLGENDIFSQLYPEGYQPPEPPKPPKEDAEVYGYINPTESIDGMSQSLIESLDNGLKPLFDSLIKLDDKYKTPINEGGFGGGGAPQISITSQPINVAVVMDKSVFGRASVEAIQTVTIAAGGTVPINYGGR